MIRWKALIRDVIIIFVLTFLGGVLVGIASAGHKMPMAAIAISNLIFMIVGATISGSIVKTNRFRHLFHVAIATWLLSAFNMLSPYASLVQWLGSIIVIVIGMFIGGGISFVFAKTPKEETSQPKPEGDGSKLAAP